MRLVDRFKLWIMILAAAVFGVACHTGSAHLKYETPDKSFEYDRTFETEPVPEQANDDDTHA